MTNKELPYLCRVSLAVLAYPNEYVARRPRLRQIFIASTSHEDSNNYHLMDPDRHSCEATSLLLMVTWNMHVLVNLYPNSKQPFAGVVHLIWNSWSVFGTSFPNNKKPNASRHSRHHVFKRHVFAPIDCDICSCQKTLARPPRFSLLASADWKLFRVHKQ